MKFTFRALLFHIYDVPMSDEWQELLYPTYTTKIALTHLARHILYIASSNSTYSDSISFS